MTMLGNYPNLRPSLLLDFANAQQLDPRITFSRSTTAPYYDGKTSALAEQNLFLYSQDFDNAYWGKTNITVTANSISAPDGTLTAELVTLTGATATKFIYPSSSPSVTAPRVFSIYVKAGTYNFVQLMFDGGTAYANFDISTGTAGTVVGGTSSITSDVNGWYRVQLTSSITGNFRLYAVDSNTANWASSTSATGNFYIWGAQVENRSTVTAYNATTTTAITNYIPQLLTAPINQPRFDFNPTTGESLGLLIEQSSTNLFNYSEQFNNAYWNAGNSTVSANQIIAPDGNQTGDLWTCTAGSARHYFIAGTTTTGSYSCSVYLKKGTNQYFQIAGSSAGFYANFDFGLGVVGTTGGANILSSSITLVGNSWYRCVVNFTAASDAIWLLQVNSASASVLQSFTATGYETMFIWGAQLETLAFATSYIPTTSAQVTRAADVAQMTGTNFSSWYNQNQGTFFADYIANQSLPTTIIAGIFGCGPGGYATTNSSQLFLANSGGIFGYYQPNGFPEITLYANVKPLIGKIAMSYSLTLGTLVVNNSTVITQSGNFPNNGGINSIQFGTRDYNSSVNYLNGWIKKFAYYPQQVTTTNQQALTGS